MSFFKICIIFFVFFSFSYGLELSDLAGVSAFTENFDKTKQFSNLAIQQSSIQNAFNSIDENYYLVGPGDEFSILNTDLTTVFYKGIINQNNEIVIPGLTTFFIGKVTLATAKKNLIEHLTKISKKSFSVSFIKPKDASITIAGKINTPGTYQVSSSMRIFDIINLANPKTTEKPQTILRFVTIQSKDTTVQVDLFKFLYLSDLSQNPYVYPGDHIFVNFNADNIYASGELLSLSGEIPILNNENLYDLLKILKLSSDADSSNIIIQRIVDTDKRSIFSLDINKSDTFKLKNNDIIVLPKKKNYSTIDFVSVEGEIVSPGSYPIIIGQITTKEVISQAGGVTQEGDINRAVILRRGKTFPDGISTVSVRPEISAAQNKLKLFKDYEVIRIKDNSEIVEPGDLVFVPRKGELVHISGNVKNPGGYAYKPNKDIKYYISEAGGFSKNADKKNITVLTTYDKVIVNSEKEFIEPGDLILVPLEPDKKVFTTIVLPIIQAVATTVSIILAIYTTSKDN